MATFDLEESEPAAGAEADSAAASAAAAPARPSRYERLRASALARGIPLPAILATCCIVVAFYLTGKVAYQLRNILLMIAVAAFFTVLLNPIVNYVQRGVRRRGWAVTVVVTLSLCVFLGLAALFGYPLLNGLTHLAGRLPSYVHDAADGHGWIGQLTRRLRLQQWVAQNAPKLQTLAASMAKPALNFGKGAASVLATLLTIFGLATLFLLEGPRMSKGLLDSLPPERAERYGRMASDINQAVTGYVLGNLATSLIAGVVVFIDLAVLGIPFPLLWALWVALVDFLPMVGGALAGIPTVLFAATMSLTDGIVTAVVFIAYQQLENRVLNPLIMGKTVRVSPLLVLLSVLVGTALGDWVGGTFGAFVAALLSIPLAAALQVITKEIWRATALPRLSAARFPVLAAPIRREISRRCRAQIYAWAKGGADIGHANAGRAGIAFTVAELPDGVDAASREDEPERRTAMVTPTPPADSSGAVELPRPPAAGPPPAPAGAPPAPAAGPPASRRGRLRYLVSVLGPGLITGAADDDPSGIATYSQTGAQFGYGQLWTALWMLPLVTGVQEACGRIGNITGQGLARNIKDRYRPPVLWGLVLLLAAANTINIGADIGAIGAGASLIIHLPAAALMVIFTAGILALEITVSYRRYASYLKWLTVSLLAYPATALLVSEPWRTIARATIAWNLSLSTSFFYVITAILGTTISPYMFFWQTSGEVEENKGKTRRSLRDLRADNAIGMVISQVVAWFIVIVAATVLHGAGVTTINTAADAARALEPLVRTFPHSGEIAQGLFALGIVSLGMLAVPVLAGSTSYALSEARGKQEGLDLAPRQGRYFYGIIAASMVIGLCLNFSGVNPIRFLVFAAVFNAIAAVPLVWIVNRIASDRHVMGQAASGWLSRSTMALTLLGMSGSVAAIAISAIAG